VSLMRRQQSLHLPSASVVAYWLSGLRSVLHLSSLDLGFHRESVFELEGL
jgi:hypothetical protein